MIEIENFTIESYDAVFALWRQSEGVGLHDDCDSRAGIQSYLEHNPGMSFIARDGKAIVGAVLVGTDGRRGYIHHLAVHADYRRKGIGRDLVGRSIRVLKSAGVSKAHIFIFAENADGVAFWQAAGWSVRTDIRVMSKLID